MATVQELETALVNADKAGDVDAARKLAAAVTRARASAPPPSPADLIPGSAAQNGFVIPPQPERTMGQRVEGAIETGLATASGVTGGTLGMVGGTLKGLAEQILSGQFGTKEAADLVEKSAAQGAQALTYAPRTKAGQEYTEKVGSAMQELIPIAPMTAEMAGLSRAVAPVRRAATDTVQSVRSSAAPAVARATEAVRNAPQAAADMVLGRGPGEVATPGTGSSVGAAGVDMATQRRTLAEGLPVPVRLTKGQASRDAAQLKFEVETSKLPEEGARLRERIVQQNDAILRNLDTWIDQTGAEAPSLRAAGIAVDEALVKQAKRDKTEVNAAYTKAKKSPEAQVLVDQSLPVAIGEGEAAMSSTPLSFLNEQPSGLPNTALADAARQYAVRLGIAEMEDAGQLAPKQATIRQLEDWRKAISQATGYEPSDIRQATILKKLIDGQTEPVAGPLFRDARNLRARYAQNYENRATVSKLLSTKRGTTDRQVAFEDVFDHAILKGSLDDVRNVRRILQRGGEEGQQAWRELQGQTASWIRDQATKNVQSDSSGARVVSPAALTKSLRQLDADGRLDFIFGKKGAQQLRDLADLAEYAKTVPPESAVNTSNTAATLAGLVDVLFSGFTGTPAPITTATRLVVKKIKDAKLRRRISDALGEAEKRAPGRRRPTVSDPSNQSDPQQAPARTIH